MSAHEYQTPWRDDEDDDDLDEEESEAVDVDEGPGEHDRHLTEDRDADSVQCPKCGKYVWSEAKRCHKCGHYFAGEAWQLLDAPSTGGWWPRMRYWMLVGVIFVTVVAMILVIVTRQVLSIWG